MWASPLRDSGTIQGSLGMDFLLFGGDRGALSGTLRDSQVRVECPISCQGDGFGERCREGGWGEVRILLLAGQGHSLPLVRVSKIVILLWAWARRTQKLRQLPEGWEHFDCDLHSLWVESPPTCPTMFPQLRVIPPFSPFCYWGLSTHGHRCCFSWPRGTGLHPHCPTPRRRRPRDRQRWLVAQSHSGGLQRYRSGPSHLPITDAPLLEGPRLDGHVGGFVPCKLASAQTGPSQFILFESLSERHWNSQPGQEPFVLRVDWSPQRPGVSPCSGSFGGSWSGFQSTAISGLPHT